MKTTALVLLSLALVGCGGPAFEMGTSGTSQPEAGGPETSVEAGQDADPEAGQDAGDSGQVDSGNPSETGTDSGTTPTDSGTNQDSGTTPQDSGSNQDSGSPQDSGTGCSTGETMCNGSCQPGVCVLATGIANLSGGVAVNSKSVFWTQSDLGQALGWVPCNGGTVGGIATAVTLGSAYSPLAVNDSTVYWSADTAASTSGDVMATAISGASSTIATGSPGVQGVVIDDTNVYWADPTGGTILQRSLGGGGVITVASGQASPVRLTIDSQYVYWTNEGTGPNFTNGSIVRAPIGGGQPPTTLASALSSVGGVAVDSTGVYWTSTSDGTVTKCPLTGCNGTYTWQIGSQKVPNEIASDGTNVYWTNTGSGGGVHRASVGGTQSGQPFATASKASGLALDATTVYWTDLGTGSVSKQAK